MKNLKSIIAISLLAVCAFTGIANAAGTTSTSHAIHTVISHGKVLKSAQDCYNTDIWVVNNSDYVITMRVPQSSDYPTTLYPGDASEIYSDYYYNAIEVVLTTQDGYVIFDNYVQNHSTVTIDNPYLGSKAPRVSI